MLSYFIRCMAYFAKIKKTTRGEGEFSSAVSWTANMQPEKNKFRSLFSYDVLRVHKRFEANMRLTFAVYPSK
jgi:hypothetical protein